MGRRRGDVAETLGYVVPDKNRFPRAWAELQAHIAREIEMGRVNDSLDAKARNPSPHEQAMSAPVHSRARKRARLPSLPWSRH